MSSAPVGGGRNFEPSALSIASLLKGGGFDETWHLRGANDRYRRWGTVEELGKPPKVLSIADIARASANGSFVPILLQKSELAGRPIFRKNRRREATVDSSSRSRLTEVASEFDVRR